MKTSAAASQNMSPMLDHTDSADKTQDVAYVVTKFLSKGYDALSNEELAATLINPDFNATFKKQTGTDWIAKYQIQTIDKLKNTNFDLNFMTSGITHEKFNAFFVAVIKGDLEVIRDYFRKYTDDELLRIVDVSKKSPLHHAAREGRTSMADYLMTKGFRVNSRERTLKTPLHYACLFGHAVLADLLLKRGGDILAKDCSGRTAFHFACCSWSSETIALVLGLKPELINLGDNIGRTGLHYSVWNSCDAQVDIMRTIIERGANINQVDDYGKTALHYAAEGGRTRAIPILIQKGIDMSLRESRTHKTALELACNERVRELMIVYSSAPYTLKSKDKSFLDSAIKGESVIVRKETLFTDEKQIKKSNPSAFAESVPIGKSNALVPEYWRSKLIGIMTQLQDIGVKSSQHIKRPYLFTGSWLEGVTTIEQLYDRVKGLSANEAMLRLFNILHPFEGDLPASNKEEVAISNFYGEYYNFEVPKETRVDLSAIGSTVIEQSKIASMHSALELANKKNEDLQAKIVALQKDVAEAAQQLSHYKTRSSELESTRTQYQKLQDTLRTKETDILMAKKLTDELESRIKSEVTGKNSTIEALQKDLSERDQDLAKVKKELNASKAQLKILEAGQKQDGPSAYGGSNSAKVMNKFERKRYISQELTKEDHAAIQGLMARLRTSPPELATRLRTEDKNADGLINSYEFLQAMDKLKLLPEESSTLRAIAGFQKYDEIFIEDFVELVNRKMNMDGFTEKSILTSFVTAFHAKRMTVKEALAQYDKNADTQLDIGELKQLVLDVGLMIDDKSLQELFNILDTDGSGSISFDEFRTKLSAVELQKMVENPDKAKELNDKMKDKTAPKDIAAKRKDALAKLKGLNALDDALEKEKDKFETVDDAERLRNILGKELFGNGKEVTKMHDYEPLVGEIKIQFQKVGNVNINLKDYKMLYILIRVPGITKNWLEKEIHPYAIEQFKYAMRITVMNVLSENIGRDVVLKLVGEDKNDLRVDLGTTQVPWKKGLELANEWIVNDTFAFESNGKTSPCNTKIQLKWITAGSPEFKASVYDDYYLKKAFAAPKQEEGFLQVNLASALLPDVPKSNGEKLSLKVITPDSKSYTVSPEQAIDEEYQFNQMYVVPVKFLKEDPLASVYVQLKNGKDVLGEAYINWSECIFFPKEQSENRAFLLYKDRARTKHKVYVRMQYLTKAQAQLLKLDDKKDIAKDKSAYLTGIMKVGIIRARKLVGDEKGKDGSLTCDPLVRVRFKNHEKYVKFETGYQEQNINPAWDENYSFNVKLLKEAAFPPLEVEVFDHDTWSANDLVGSVKIRTNDCFAKPCTWAVNGFFPIENSGKPAGEVYMCIYFVPEGKFDPNINAIDVETSKEIVPKVGVGKLHFRLIAGRDLVWLKEGIVQPKASPYVELSLPNDKKRSSKPVSDNLNPNWNYQLMETVDLQPGTLAPVKLEVWHKTGMLSKDIKMSEVTVDLSKLLAAKGTWAINELVSLPGEDKYLRPNSLKDMGKLYIQAKVVENSRVDDESEPEMKIEMPKLAEGEVKGMLMIHVVHCKDLPKVDSGVGGNLCDAFVQVNTKGGDKVYTKTKWGDLNPIFNQRLLMQYKLSSASEVEPLRIEIRDEDKMSGSDLVGTVEIDLHPVITAPGTWSVNKIFNIQNIEKEYLVKGETPQVYLQVKFLKEGQMDEGIEPPLLEDLTRTVSDRRRKGTLIIRAIHARGLIKADTGLAGSSSDPYIEFIAPPTEKSYKTKVMKNTIIPIWKEEFKHPIEIPDIRYVSKLGVKVWDHDNMFAGGSDDFLGEVDIDITPCLNDANAWAINKVFELTGPQKMKEKLKLKNFGFVYLQMLFLKEGEQLTTKEPQVIEDLEKMSKAAETPGLLVVNVVHAKGLMRGDKAFFGGPGSSDPFVRINWPNGKESSTAVRKGTTTPVWTQVLQQQLVINKLNIPLLHLEVYDDDMMTKDLLGYCFIDLDQTVATPGKWIINGNSKLEGGPDFVKEFKSFGEVYVQVLWLEGTGAKFDNQLPPVTENLKEVIERASVKGKLEIKLIHCANLIGEDDSGLSDPYVIFVMPDKKEITSRKLTNTVNPIFNQDISHPLTIQDTFIEPIEMRVMDSDTLNPDDPLGKATISIEECVYNPGQWKINKILKLEPFGSMKLPAEGEPPRELGEIYIQARFVKDGLTDNTPPPALVKDLEKELKDKRVEGKLWLVVVHAKGLQVEKPRNAKISCTLKIEGVNDKGETTKTAISRNPAFGDVIQFSFNLESEKSLKPLKVTLVDNGFISLTSSVVGEVSIDLQEMLKVPKGQWFMNKIYKLTGPKDLFDKFKGNIGEVYLQAKFQDAKADSLGERPQLLEDISKTISTERLKGKLIIYMISVMDVVPYDGKTSDPLVEIKFHKDTQKTKCIEKTVNAEYKSKHEFAVDFDSIEFVPSVLFEVIDWNMTFNQTIGSTVVDLKKCFETPNKYAFNEVLKLAGPEKLQGKYRSFGSIYFQAKFQTEGTPDADDFAPMIITMEDHMKKNRVKGTIIVSVVHAKYLLDNGKLIDPYLKLVFPSKAEVETKTVKGTSFPVWGQRVEGKVDLSRNDAGFLDFEVKDNCWGRDGNIGRFTVDIDACYGQPNTWAVNSVFLVKPPTDRTDLKEGSCGKVYLQVKYLPEGVTEDPIPPIMLDTTPEEDRKKEGLYGQLKFIVKSAKDLPNKDSWGSGVSDPYTMITLPDGQEKRTKVIDDNLNPVWNETLVFDVKIDASRFKPIEVEVFDKDVTTSDSCGKAVLGIEKLKSKPNEWGVNEILSLVEGKTTKGKLYIIGKFIPEGATDSGPLPPELTY